MKSKQKIDLLLHNATVYTVDESFSKAEAVAVDKGKIIAIGNSKELLEVYDGSEQVDAKNKFIFPGFIDAHAHFFGYGLGLQQADLVGTKSWEDVVEKLKIQAGKIKKGWITGRGWNQNDWAIQEFPGNEKLNELFPTRPVILTRVDGHAAIANETAMQLAALKAGDKTEGGEVEVKNGKLTGVLIDNAMDLVYAKIPRPSETQLKKALMDAEKNCFAAGLTTIVDCGQDYESALFVDSLQKKKELKIRLFIMMSDKQKNYDFLFKNGKIKTERLNVCSFKLFSDGALGSRGAYLLQPYSDKPGWKGLLLKPEEHFDARAKQIAEKGFQMCTHAIGDAANRMMLKIYAEYLKGKNDRRWRIEHAQILNKDDFHYFGDYNIVPSIQPTHATSDMHWAVDRLGKERLHYSYAYNDLKNQNGWIPLGTDFPVEDISPFKTFYASVFRKDTKGWPAKGFQMENALSREDTIRGMTIWAAKANFEEQEKGSLEKGKFADLVLLDTDLMNVDEKAILKTKVLMTFVNGEKVFEANL
ncbi:MAG: amidohydrolase [Bacteroidota bacterium]|nr:amidohydrolase [Bacteroidota bacterium]